MRNEFDRRSHAGDAEHDENDAGHQRSDYESIDTEALNNSVDDHDECAGGSPNLDARSPQGGDQEARNDRSVQAAIGRNAASDRKSDGKGQSNDTDDYARHDIGGKL